MNLENTIKLIAGDISKLSYDDRTLGVYNEALVSGTDEVILSLGFEVGDYLTFGMADTLADIPIDEVAAIAVKDNNKQPLNATKEDGTWYLYNEHSFWLCRHLFDYCTKAPRYIYIKAKQEVRSFAPE